MISKVSYIRATTTEPEEWSECNFVKQFGGPPLEWRDSGPVKVVLVLALVVALVLEEMEARPGEHIKDLIQNVHVYSPDYNLATLLQRA
ncbi:uncharacterized protein [Cherax quadricarinatus]|uniref:uncharacterized protein isoform X3 n=1 Tax=Cherax quadricarinatus TaxID=27406 RepID=UPI002377D32F|nr:uncharacterized protein LOC128695953 isoform X3 [Cherax quadricarinatus]